MTRIKVMPSLLRSHVWLLAALCVCAYAMGVQAQRTGSMTTVYTSANGSEGPRYPLVDLAFPMPGAPPRLQDLQLTAADAQGAELPLGNATTVRRFGETGYGIETILALDASGSMQGKPLLAMRASLGRFVADARPQDRVGIATFADDTRWDVALDHGSGNVSEAIARIRARGQKTRLYDALLLALETFDGKLKRRELIVISDGHDEGSSASEREVVDAAKRLQIPVEAIGLTRSNPVYLQALERLTAATGGSFQQAHSDAELDSLIAGSIEHAKLEPVATFDVGALPEDGRVHRLTLRWPAKNFAGVVELTFPVGGSKQQAKAAKTALWLRYGGIALGVVGLAGVALLVLRRNGLASTRSLLTNANDAKNAFEARTAQPERAAAVAVVTPDDSALADAGNQSSPAPLSVGRITQPRVPEAPNQVTQMVQSFPAADGQIFAWLVATHGPLAGSRTPVASVAFWVGAADGCDLKIVGDAMLSSRHALFSLEASIWGVEDNTSTNGTFLNGQRLDRRRRPLRSGDEIRMGTSIFRVLPA